MSNSILDLYNYQALNTTAIDNISANEAPSAALTLTRSGTLAITTAGTLITWQSELRNFGFTWTGTAITIPTSGFYSVTMLYTTTGAHTVVGRVFINTVNVAFMASTFSTSVRQALTITRYFTTGDSVEINLLPNVNTTISVIAENAAGESPILHIVQHTGAYEI
jgi:hypothetical protein